MGRTHVTAIQQPDDTTCGPAALKAALEIIGIRKSLPYLIKLCKTNTNGTSTKNLIKAINKLGASVLVVEYATLRHLRSALRYKSTHVRSVMVTYLYDLNEKKEPHPDSGHWATVSSYMVDKGRIVLLDSAKAQKKSYLWSDFRERWYDYDLKRRRVDTGGRHFQLVRRWQSQLLLVIAKKPEHLPKFSLQTQKVFLPVS